MAFSQATITSVSAPLQRAGQVFLKWTSSSPDGTLFQVYVGRRLAWAGQGRSCSIPAPTAPGVRVDIGTVDAGEQFADFSGSLPAAPANRADIAWLGGTYEAADVAGYRIYGEHSPGGGIDYGAPLATLAAYPGGVVTDGWGMGGWGRGGWGHAASSYAWTSGPLAAGTWSFAIRPFDVAGNEGTARVGAVVIAVPPPAPPPFADSARLHYAYDPGTRGVTLTWNPSS